MLVFKILKFERKHVLTFLIGNMAKIAKILWTYKRFRKISIIDILHKYGKIK